MVADRGATATRASAYRSPGRLRISAAVVANGRWLPAVRAFGRRAMVSFYSLLAHEQQSWDLWA